MSRLGAALDGNSTVFTVRSPTADLVELALFDGEREQRTPMERTGDDFTITLPDIQPGTTYGYRSHGRWDPDHGVYHDPSKLLIDPHARAIVGQYVDHPSHRAHNGADTAPFTPRAVVVTDPTPPRAGPIIAPGDRIIYEAHVRGLTMRHPDIPPNLRGTYAGAASDPVIDHLRALGITTVELMPVAAHASEAFLQRRSRANYWGYSTLNWFSPHSGYAIRDDGSQVAEFAELVDRFHQSGLEVIVDVVFNHTVEGGSDGPVLSMKGLDNSGWYRLDPNDPSRFLDWTGTGNTVDTSSPTVRSAILEALVWWHRTLGVDGFRFDLGVTLGRGTEAFSSDNLAWITDDADLQGATLIAEPWDLGPDGYRLGGFGGRWMEWNGRFRDDIRDVWKGAASRGVLATRLAGSADLFDTRGPLASVNFVTAHDGFTLADLVSYDAKHNLANGEENRDGHDDNRSWNSGVEGPTDDPSIEERRHRRAAGILATLLLSKGTPMLLGGDELGRTKRGNNNSYSLDDETNWFDWSDSPLVTLVQRLCATRRAHPVLTGPGFLTPPGDAPPDVVWLDTGGDPITEWTEVGPLIADMSAGSDRVLLAINPTDEAAPATLPPGLWHLEFDSTDRSTGVELQDSVDLGEWSVLLFRPAD